MTRSKRIRHIALSADDSLQLQVRQLRLRDYPKDHSGVPERAHRHQFHELIWISKGRGRQEIDGVEMQIKPRTMYVIAAGQVHRFVRGANLVGTIIRFADEFLPATPSHDASRIKQGLLNDPNRRLQIHVAASQIGAIEQLLELMLAEFTDTDDVSREAVLTHLLQILLIKLDCAADADTQIASEPADHRERQFREFLSLVETHYRDQHGVDYYAGELALSPRDLSRQTTRFIGKSAKRMIEERLILEAKRHLRYTAVSVKEVAYRLGFKDPSHFSKRFKQVAGISPADYRLLRGD